LPTLPPTPEGRELGAEGIGLCVPSNMFFEGNQGYDAFREMICAGDHRGERSGSGEDPSEQQGDFEKLYEAS
jgi:hypothetical protein